MSYMKSDIDTDVVKVEFSKIYEKLQKKNINLHFCINKIKNNDDVTVNINKNIELESDNNFWGNVTSLFTIGRFSYNSSNLGYGISCGRYCSIAAGVSIMGAHHYPDWISTSPVFYEKEFSIVPSELTTDRKRRSRKILIGNDVWIGANVVLKSNISIGDGAIIAGNSVVTKDVPAFAIVGGNPAKLIRYRFSQDVINHIFQLRWWRFNKDQLKGLDASTPSSFLENLEFRISNGDIFEEEKNIFRLDYLLN